MMSDSIILIFVYPFRISLNFLILGKLLGPVGYCCSICLDVERLRVVTLGGLLSLSSLGLGFLFWVLDLRFWCMELSGELMGLCIDCLSCSNNTCLNYACEFWLGSGSCYGRFIDVESDSLMMSCLYPFCKRIMFSMKR